MNEEEEFAFRQRLQGASSEDRWEATIDVLVGIKKDLAQIKTDIKPITEIYKGFQFGNRIILGTAGLAMALAAIGGAIVAFIRFAVSSSHAP